MDNSMLLANRQWKQINYKRTLQCFNVEYNLYMTIDITTTYTQDMKYVKYKQTPVVA